MSKKSYVKSRLRERATVKHMVDSGLVNLASGAWGPATTSAAEMAVNGARHTRTKSKKAKKAGG